MDRLAHTITDNELTRPAEVLLEEEDGMRPEVDGVGGAERDDGEVAFYRNSAQAVLLAATELRIRGKRILSPHALINHAATHV